MKKAGGKMKKSTIAAVVIVVWGISSVMIGIKDPMLVLYTGFPGWIAATVIAYFLCAQEEKEEKSRTGGKGGAVK